jgi:hypothetical protein
MTDEQKAQELKQGLINILTEGGRWNDQAASILTLMLSAVEGIENPYQEDNYMEKGLYHGFNEGLEAFKKLLGGKVP